MRQNVTCCVEIKSRRNLKSKSRFRQAGILPLVLFRLVIGGILVAAFIELHGELRRTTNRFFDYNGNICLFFIVMNLDMKKARTVRLKTNTRKNNALKLMGHRIFFSFYSSQIIEVDEFMVFLRVIVVA